MSKLAGKKCCMCGPKTGGPKPAQFYTFSDGKQFYFCSRKCHVKFNKRKAKFPNLLLIQLTDEDKGDEPPKDDNDSLFESCQRGEENSNRLVSFLESGASPDQQNQQGQSLLTYSVAKGDIRTVGILLGAGADINKADGKKKTPLMAAASIGADMKVALLLKSGANSLLQDDDGRTALHFTESNTTPDCAKLLLEHEPELVNVKNNFEQTAAHIMAGAGNDVVLSVLLEHGAAIDTLDNLQRAPLHWAILEKAEMCVPLLLDGEDGRKVMDSTDRFGSRPIHYAAQLNNMAIVKLLLEKGCDLNVTDPLGRTPLLVAASEGNQDVCLKLIEIGCDVHDTDNQGFSALHYAAAKGTIDVCKSLIKSGVDVDHRNKKEQTAIFEAVSNAHVDIVHTLIEKGAKLDGITDINGRNPSHYAAEHGHKGMLRVILQYSEVCSGAGCDLCDPSDNPIHSMDNQGHTTLYLAAANKHIACLKMLIKRGVFVDDESYGLLAEMGLVDIVDKNKRLSDHSDKEELPSDGANETEEGSQGFQSEENDCISDEEQSEYDVETAETDKDDSPRSSDDEDKRYEQEEFSEGETEEVTGEGEGNVLNEELRQSEDEDENIDVEGDRYDADYEDSGQSDTEDDDTRESDTEDEDTRENDTEDEDTRESDTEDEDTRESHTVDDVELEKDNDKADDQQYIDKTEKVIQFSLEVSEEKTEKCHEVVLMTQQLSSEEIEANVHFGDNQGVEEIPEVLDNEESTNGAYIALRQDDNTEEIILPDQDSGQRSEVKCMNEEEPSVDQSLAGRDTPMETRFEDKYQDSTGTSRTELPSEIENDDVGSDDVKTDDVESETDSDKDEIDSTEKFRTDSPSEEEQNNYNILINTMHQSVKHNDSSKITKENELVQNTVFNLKKSTTDIPLIEERTQDVDIEVEDDGIFARALKPKLLKASTLPEIKKKRMLYVSTYFKNPLVWKKKYADQRKQTISLEEKLNKLKTQVDQYQRKRVSHMEHRKESGMVQARLREPQLSLCQQTYKNEQLKMQVEIRKTKASSETKLRDLQQKKMNDIRTLRDDYRNAIKKFTKTLDDIKLLDAPDWFHPGKVHPNNPTKSKWMLSSRKLSYSQKFQTARGENENKIALRSTLVSLAQKKREKSAKS